MLSLAAQILVSHCCFCSTPSSNLWARLPQKSLQYLFWSSSSPWWNSCSTCMFSSCSSWTWSEESLLWRMSFWCSHKDHSISHICRCSLDIQRSGDFFEFICSIYSVWHCLHSFAQNPSRKDLLLSLYCHFQSFWGILDSREQCFCMPHGKRLSYCLS